MLGVYARYAKMRECMYACMHECKQHIGTQVANVSQTHILPSGRPSNLISPAHARFGSVNIPRNWFGPSHQQGMLLPA